MENLSNSAHRGKMQMQRSKKEPAQQHNNDYTFEGQPVLIVETFSRGGRRIAVIEDREGEVFEVFFEQLD